MWWSFYTQLTPHQPTHSLTHPHSPSLTLTHPHSPSLTHSLTHSLTPSLTPSLTHSLTLTHSTHSLTHSHHSLTFSFTYLCMHIRTHIHKKSPTIIPPSLLYLLFPSCLSLLSLSLEKLVTCGVIRSYNAFGFFCTASSPFTNLLVLCPKTAPCPEAVAQATTAAAAADQAADHCKSLSKTSPGWVLTGCNFNEVRTSVRAKVLSRTVQNRNLILLQFLASEPHFVRTGCRGTLQI